MKNFSEMFAALYACYGENSRAKGTTPSYLSFARFLGHGHEGRIRAWKKGQWPSAEDIWQLHLKLGFSLRWLVSGEGDPFEAANPINISDSGSTADAAALVVRLEALEREIGQKGRELEAAEKERDGLMRELLVIQREHLSLLRERAEGAKGGGRSEAGPEPGAPPSGNRNETFHEPRAVYRPDKKRR